MDICIIGIISIIGWWLIRDDFAWEGPYNIWIALNRSLLFSINTSRLDFWNCYCHRLQVALFSLLTSPTYFTASMKEGTGTAPTDTPETIQSPAAAELAIAWPYIAEQPHPSRRIQSKFWSAGRKKIPSYACSPWDYYEPFLNLSSRTSLVLCNDKSTLRVIQSCGANQREGASTDESLDGSLSLKYGIKTLLTFTNNTCSMRKSLLSPSM